jgi:hypothetical protein
MEWSEGQEAKESTPRKLESRSVRAEFVGDANRPRIHHRELSPSLLPHRSGATSFNTP